MTARPDHTNIDRVWPAPEADLGDELLLAELRGGAPLLRVNFVASVDGVATREGLSGGLSNDADRRYFELLRRASDAVVVGAGTVRAEGYGSLRVSDESVRWRREQGLSDHPVFVIVSRSLDIDPAIVADAPVRPILVTTGRARVPEALAEADIVRAGDSSADESVDGTRMRAALHERGLMTLLCEGGPHLFASLLDADVVDELCLTTSPVLEGGDGIRITAGLEKSRGLELVSILRSKNTLFVRYRRARG